MEYTEKLQRNINISYIAYFLTGLIFTIPIWVAFNRRILSFTQIALLSSLSYGLTTFLELPTGALADLIGRRKTIILGYFLLGAAVMYISWADSFFDFFVGEFVIAIGAALISGADVALIFDSLKELGKPEFFSKFMAKTSLIHHIALAIGSFTGGYIYQIWIGLPYFLQGSLQIFSAGLFIFLTEPKIDTEKFSLKNYIKQTKDGFKQLFQSSYMIKLTVFYTLVGGITWSVIYYFNQPFASDFGFSSIEQSWIFGACYLITSAVVVFLTHKENILTRNRVYLGFPIIMLLSFLPGFWAPKFIAPLLLLGAQIVGSARFAVLDMYTNKEFLSKYRATAISALNMLVSFFYIIIVAISGRLQDAYNTKLIFTGLGVLTLIFVIPSGLSLVMEYKKYLRKKEQNE